MRQILIMGATSAIAEATARELASIGAALFIVGRSQQRLDAIAADLRLRGASQVAVKCLDARELTAYPNLVEEAERALGGLDGALIAHGTLSDQKACEQSISLLADEFATNALSVMALAGELANRFEAQRRGVIAIISSVAGDRGRQSNYVYGAAKAAVTAFASGLRQRLYRSGVSVVTIKPGFVATPMTASFRKGALWATPAQVAKPIAKAMRSGKPVLYVPWFWWGIMAIIRTIPERIFRGLKL
ncbi:MAG: SDR family oxidoreductase [Steroidobacteraceae bacterium]